MTIRVDFHLHTVYSKDSLSDPMALYRRALKLGLGKLVITDHNTISGALRMHKMFPDFVIVGEEIKTTAGEILALFVTEEVPAGLQPLEAFKRLKDQGAFISLSHPFAFGRYGWQEEEILRYGPYLDAIETLNGRNTEKFNQMAVDFAAMHHLAGTAGSDGHAVHELGRMGLLLPDFNDAESLRKSVKQAEPFGKVSSLLVRVYSRSAVLMKKIGAVKPKQG